MALFGKKKSVKKASGDLTVSSRDLSQVIKRPVVTEKAARLGDQNVYAFFVAQDATKRDVRDAVIKLWNVNPAKIRVVKSVARPVYIRAKNRMGVESGSKKAYIHLKEGDRIDLV